MMKQIIGFIFLIICSSTVMAAKLLSIEIQHKEGNPSLLFKLDSVVTHKVFTLTNPNRVVVDLDNTTLAVDLKSVNLGKGLIKYLRSGHPTPYTLRLVLEVDQAVFASASSLRSSKTMPHAFSLAISKNKRLPLQPPKKEGANIVNHSIPLKPTGVVVRRMPPNSLRDVVIVLDPGHGGKDPGAMGPRHTAEKHLTLAIAKKLKQIIDRQPGMHAVLTREADYYIGLRERLKISRKYNGDVFVSIHADAFINQNSSGVSVFALSQSGATSEAARWLAEKENYSELGGVNLSGLDDQTGLVRTVLIDLSQTATIGASLSMGDRVLRNLDKITNLHNQKVEQARFMVLKAPDIPSILIETGFISNPREERNLNSSLYQNRLTQAIFEGLKRYFWDYPPHGTRIEALVGNSTFHWVQKGETLPSIARKYQVSVAALQVLNNLTETTLKTGQKITIPV